MFEDLTDIKKEGKKKNKNNKDSKAINEKVIRIIIKTIIINPKDSGQISTDGHTDYSRNLLIINPKIEHYT